ncbi:MAG: CbiX/SirB N-terminal domain-containing protein [Betaproteobacteria bacterium]|jgi:sirohydrochlorin cobaltochelatase|nr:CbiX/SirB N-terminal domain-containing protein [Betaproteobacteria bacterium]
MPGPALILFAHGARDARWTAPFERVLERVARAAPERSPMLAYLEFIAPNLPSAIAQQVARGHRSIRIVPLFLGQGGHVRADVPRLIEAARAAHPGVAIELARSAGEDDGVVDALAAFALR